MVQQLERIARLPSNQDKVRQSAIQEAIKVFVAADVRDENIYTHHAFTFYPERRGFVKMSPDGREIHLTKTEANLLKIMVGKVGRVAEFAELYGALPGRMKRDQSLIKWHIQSLRRKLEPEARKRSFKLILSVSGVGYMLSDTDSASATS